MFARLRSTRGTKLFVEIMMIVVGINIALWFEGLAEDFGDRETERQYLRGLHDDLAVDVRSIDHLTTQIEAKIENLQAIMPGLRTLNELPPGEQAQALFAPSSYFFFQPSDFTYTAMQESGDFRLLEDPETKKRLLRLVRQYRLIDGLQKNFIQAMDSEFIPLLMGSFDIVSSRITDPGLMENQVFINFYPFTLQDSGTRLNQLKAARKQASELMVVIEEQLGTGP